MKPSRSSQRLHLITDLASQTDTLRRSSTSKNKTPSTCKNVSRKFSDVHTHMPQTCKNHGQMMASCGPNVSGSGNKIQKSRSNSNLAVDISGEYPYSQNRKQQVDNLYFQRIINILKKLFIDQKCNWDFDQLNYHQLIKILYRLKYVQYPTENEYMTTGDQQELKKVYCLWLSISVKRFFTLHNLLQVVMVLEKVNVQIDKIENFIDELKKEVSLSDNFNQFEDNTNIDPSFVFFMKKIDLKRENKILKLGNHQKNVLIQKFQSFKLNKLKDASLTTCTKNTEPEIQDLPLVSKKSVELASAKRQKITAQIKTKHPQVENIDLVDLLNYRERDFGNRTPRTPTDANHSRFQKKKKNLKQMKKQINQLSKPKNNGQHLTIDELQYERNKQDYTFTPKINFMRSGSQEKLKNIKNIEKTVLRMKQARQIKQQKQNMISKGWTISQNNTKKGKKQKPIRKVLENVNQNPNNTEQSDEKCQNQVLQKPKKYQVSKEHLRIPILYIDVNIQQGRKERIVIYDNDTAVGLANQFGNKHGLPNETIERLQTLLQQQMDTVLARIDEQTEDECSILF